MSVDLMQSLRDTGALLKGHFRLSSGLHSPAYVQCARLLEHPRNARAIGESVADLIRPFQPDRIIAPALGGLIIGYAVADALDVPMSFTERKDGEMVLRRGFKVSPGERVVIVEDVVTTGKSTRETALVVEREGANVVGFGAILNRSGAANPFDRPFVSLLSLSLDTHQPDRCPLCAEGRPLDSPGSRFSGR
jgi:orotate phosphoribosyltransferase